MRRVVSRREKFQREVFVSLVALLICGLAAWPNISSIRGAVFISPRSYKTTTATITQSRVSYVSGKSSEYRFDISYSYSVGKKKYSSTQVSFGPRSSKTRAFAESYVRKYPQGLQTVVYYKANEPTFAVLEPSNVGQTRTMFWVILTILLLCITTLIFSAWRFKRSNPQNV
jgi:hypothetical protein